MIIGIDGNEANVKEKVGVNTYAFEILKNLHKLQGEWGKDHSLIVYLKDKPMPGLPKQTQNFKYKVIKGESLWIIRKLMPYLFRNPDNIDVLFSPSHYTVPFLTIPRVCAIMDLGYLEFSGQFPKKVFWQLKQWTAISIFVSKRIISISNSTAKDIVRHYPLSQGKIDVTHLGYDKNKFNTSISDDDVRRIKNKYSIVDDYVLYIGTLKPSKNIEGLVDAYSKLLSEIKEKVSLRKKLLPLKLVIAGKKGWMYESIYEKVKKLGLEEEVIFTDFIEEKDKPALIKGAKIFALPSFWEGFGLDALSAMACGTPAVVSNVGSLPEVVGSAGVLVDPNSVESIKDGLKSVLLMLPKGYNRLKAVGVLQASEFSWEKCARETLKILTSIKK